MEPKMRADAARNRAQIVDAARAVFVESGADAPFDEIARRAGVGIATLYRRFPDRDALIRAVVLDVFETLAGHVAEIEAGERDPFQAVRRYLHHALDAKIGATMPALAGRIDFDEEIDAARLSVGAPMARLMRRAQEARAVRPDVDFGDLTLMVMRLSRPMPGLALHLFELDDSALAHRQLDIYLDGLRAGPEVRTELSGPTVGLEDFEQLRAKVREAHRKTFDGGTS